MSDNVWFKVIYLGFPSLAQVSTETRVGRWGRAHQEVTTRRLYEQLQVSGDLDIQGNGCNFKIALGLLVYHLLRAWS